MAKFAREPEEGAEGSVDVEPEAVLGADLGDLGQWVACSGIRRAGVGDHDRGKDSAARSRAIAAIERRTG